MTALPSPRGRRVLGIDPGLASTGYGIIDFYDTRLHFVHCGVIESPATVVHGKRLLSIYDQLAELIRDAAPQEVGMESLYFARNVTSAPAVSEARGVVILCLTQQGIPLTEYSPNIIKQSVTGTGSSGKKAVQEYVRLLLGLQTVPRPDHAADALAAAITHIHSDW
jgi:crossover junction endodeoxyribonuclease RuvC